MPSLPKLSKKWINRLEYLGKVVGVASAVSAAVVYGISQAPEIRKILFWRDSVEVVSIDPFMNTVVLTNSGDGTVYVSSISFTVDKLAGTKDVTVNMHSVGAEIASKGTKTVQLWQSAGEGGKTSYAFRPWPIDLDGLRWLAALRSCGTGLEVATGAKCFCRYSR